MRGAKSSIDSPSQFRDTERLLDRNCTWPQCSKAGNVPTAEHMWDKPVAEYCSDSRNTAAKAKLNVDEHQIGLATLRGCDCTRFSGLNGADDIAHAFEQFAKKEAQHRLVLYHHDADWGHCFPLPRVVPLLEANSGGVH